MPFDKISKLLVKLFGSRNERLVKSYYQIAEKAGEFEQQIAALSEEQLRAKTDEFKAAIKAGKNPDTLLPEAFAVVREAAKRTLNMRHFDVQLIGGNVLYNGKIAEMATGEGKTLVATLAAYLVHLTGRHIHVITVNDYLAKRDAQWMGPVFNVLGLTVGAIQSDMDTSGDVRKEQYSCDITYGTNNEFGFDYLRDNMKVSIERMVQGDLQFAIIDEVDSILIDEARTPLIISGPAFDDVTRYKKAEQVTRRLIALQSEYDGIKKQIDSAELEIANAQGELSEGKKAKDASRIQKAQNVIEQAHERIEKLNARLEKTVQFYEVEYDKKAVHLTHEGVGAAQDIAGLGSFFTGSNMEWPHMLEQSLKAHVIFEREKDYVVIDGKVVIVDEFTGRLMQGRQWSDGLHQAVEAKEGVEVKEESQTLATITLQNFFKLYGQISGMTGTAATEADEFMNIYKLDVVIIPTNQPCIRDDRDDAIYKSIPEKFNAIVEEINEVSSKGLPILVGTISIEKSELISNALTKKYGIEHEVLNAKQHAREAAIVEKAGQQHQSRTGKMRGNVTIATNMAGRGTDIKLGPEVAKTGGLHIIGTERHEARRIDNQLRGRSGRQGDKGSSQFFLSFDDDLMKYFGGERIPKMLSLIGWQEGEPIFHPYISKQISKVQKKVEERNFEIRKNLLEYDEVMDYQRKIFYSRRRDVLKGIGLKDVIETMIESVVEKTCASFLDEKYPQRCIIEWAKSTFSVDLKPNEISHLEAAQIEQLVKSRAKSNLATEVSLSIGEYLEDYEDRSTWNTDGLAKWAMSGFSVSLTASKIKQMSPDQIEETLVEASSALVDKKDCSQLAEFLDENYAAKKLAEWANTKFEIKLDPAQLAQQKPEQIHKKLLDETAQRYKKREVEYPVEFAMGMVFGPQGPNVYGFDALAKWANKKYQAQMSGEQLAQMNPKAVHRELSELSLRYSDGELEREVDSQLAKLDVTALAQWANQRFDADIKSDSLEEVQGRRDKLINIGREFMRKELSDLEKYVLVQVYDSTWKDHLYTMDHLKESIWTRSFAEKDPKIEYKREGFRMFSEMLDSIEARVTDIIFKVHLEAGVRARSVWNVSNVSHDQVGQFAMAERQRAAAQAPQGEATKIKQIKLEQPKVGRNDACPCGSGKKYKKCCGQES